MKWGASHSTVCQSCAEAKVASREVNPRKLKQERRNIFVELKVCCQTVMDERTLSVQSEGPLNSSSHLYLSFSERAGGINESNPVNTED